MRGRKRRLAVAIVAAGAVAFVVSGGLATAARMITGRQLAPGTITSRELGRGSVTARKLARGLARSLRGPRGATGARGAAGAPGAQGPAGPAGAPGAGGLLYADQTGAVIGESVGLFSGTYPMVRNSEGAVIVYDNDPTTPYALPLMAGPLYYMQAGCAGTAYAVSTGLPFDVAIVLQSPSAPGSQIWHLQPGTPQAFTAASERTRTGCAASTTRVANAFAAETAGTLPNVTKPLRLVDAG